MTSIAVMEAQTLEAERREDGRQRDRGRELRAGSHK